MALDSLLHIDFSAMRLPIDDREAIHILHTQGFRFLAHRDMTRLVRSYLDYPMASGRISVRYNAPFHEAPWEFSPVSFVRWCYLQMGFRLPGTAHELRRGMRLCSAGELIEGDILAFTPPRGVQHFGIITKERTIVFASTQECAVVERRMEDIARCDIQGRKRILPEHARWMTLILSHSRIEKTQEAVQRLLLARIAKNA